MSLTANSTGKLLGTAAIAPGGPTDTTTVLLMHCDGTNGGTSFTDSSSYNQTITNAGSVITSTTAQKFGASSFYTNGSVGNYYLSVTNSALMFGTSNFTIEFWMNPSDPASSTRNQRLMGNLPLGAYNSGAWAIGFNTVDNGKLHIDINNGVTGLIATTAQAAGTWYHIALVRSGSTWYFFQNGIQQATTTSSVSFDNGGTARPVYIGWSGYSTSSTNEYYNGYLDEIRFTNGVALYTSNFSVATSPFATIISPTTLSLPGSSGNYMDLTVSSPANFDCTASNLFCEAWVYRNSLGQQFITTNMNASTKSYAFYFRADNKLELDTQTRSVISTNIVPTGVWTHIAFSIVVPRTSNGTRVFINGNLENTSTNATTETYVATRSFYIGYYIGDARTMNGYIRDMRVIKDGIIPITSFTPDSAPFDLAGPSYAPGGSVVLALATQYMQKMAATPATAAPLVLTGTASIASGYGAGVSNRELQGTATITYGGAPTSNTALSLPGSSGNVMNLGPYFPAKVDPSTSNVFVEAWIYFNSASSPSTLQYIFSVSDSGSEDMGFFVNFPTETGFRVWNTSGGNSQATYSPTISASQWIHFAGSWDVTNNKVYVFVNGVVGGTVSTFSGTARSRSTSSLILGAGNAGTFFPGNEYIKDFRMLKGGIVPTTTFTPVAAAPFGLGTPTYVANMGTPVLSLYTQYFYPSWLSLPGSSGNFMNLGAAHPAHFDTRTSNLFMEAWVYSLAANGSVNQQIIAVTDNSATTDWNMFIGTDNIVHFGYWAPSYTQITSGAFSFTKWNHVALSWNPVTRAMYVFLNGVVSGPTTAGTTGVYSAARELHIGSETTGSVFNGYIQDVRVIRDGIVPTTSFTPGPAPFGLVSPSYAPGGSVVLSLATQYMQKATISGAPILSQLSAAARTAAVGAYSLRAVNGATAKAVNVNVRYPLGTFSTYTTVYGVVSASSEYPPGGDNPYAWKAFDGLTASPNYWASGANYTQGVARTTGTVTVAGGTNYYGDWLQIQLPASFVPTGYALTLQQGRINAPGTWYVFGSTDGSTWTLLDTRSGIAYTSFTDQQASTFQITGATNTYNYYRIVCNIVSYNTSFALAEFVILRAADFWADRLGNLLTAPVIGQRIQDWLGGATGYVSTWYDQSGAGNNMNQTNLANQPTIQRATKGGGYMIVFSSSAANYFIGPSYTVLNNTNYTICQCERRTQSIGQVTNPWSDNPILVAGDVNFLGTNTYLHNTYRNGNRYLNGQFGNDLDAGVSNFATASTEPIRYGYVLGSTTSGRRIYIYGDPAGAPILSTNASQTTMLNMTSGDVRIGYNGLGGMSTTYVGEMYEILIFRQSLYDIDNTGGQITAIYQNQLSYTGT
jgi:hypothetical protein